MNLVAIGKDSLVRSLAPFAVLDPVTVLPNHFAAARPRRWEEELLPRGLAALSHDYPDLAATWPTARFTSKLLGESSGMKTSWPAGLSSGGILLTCLRADRHSSLGSHML